MGNDSFEITTSNLCYFHFYASNPANLFVQSLYLLDLEETTRL
jgi:hypothetical protein